jgi:pyruvate kinase
MVRIAREIHAGRPRLRADGPASNPSIDSPAEAIGAAVAAAVRGLSSVSAIWAVTESGATALMISQLRPSVPILAFTPNERVYRWLALAWGVTPVLTPVAGAEHELEASVRRIALERGLASVGDTVVLTGSQPFHRSAPTNFLKVERIGAG